MDRVVKIKLAVVLMYLTVIIGFFYEEQFLPENINFYIYDNMAFIIAVFSLGIVAGAGIYNLAFYFYIRNKHYLYYALAQFSIVALMANMEALFIQPFHNIYNFEPTLFYIDLSQVFALIFSLLFLQSFLNLYNIEKINKLIKIVIYIAIFDLVFTLIFDHAIIVKFVPSFIWVLLILSEAHRLIEKKDIPFYFLSIGWYAVLFVTIIKFLYPLVTDGNNSNAYPLLHIAFALESTLISFALSYKFKLVEKEQKKQQTLLLQQSRLASMGEMIAIIAHQWRQPLNFLSFSFMHIKRSCNGDKDALLTIKEANEQLQYMSTTIENFRNFYNPSKEKNEFDIEEACRSTLKILSPTLEPAKIKVDIEIKENFSFYANSNEFQQVILNIVNNAKDILIERKIENPKIEIIIDKDKISITDNGGGIAKEHIDKIFEPYFSTKQNSDGIGLYIAKTIIEKEMGGKLSVVSDSNGCSFVIELMERL
ncbi:PUTATIVE TWO-COMPONENT SENSOR [hydrothermal vent metagenome]|uniref:PUTATIVE TWO-COMPONENT SENSOR n=1 Tax=hydrothermal vent metagenome TaxID=652676 RepID=A0A1W1BWD3_9ZZZZ